MNFIRINDLVLKIIRDNLFKSIYDKEQSDIVTAEVFEKLLESSPPLSRVVLKKSEKSGMSLYALGIYANMILQNKKVDPSLLFVDFLINYIIFAGGEEEVRKMVRGQRVNVNLNVVTKWSVKRKDRYQKYDEAALLKNSTSHIATIFKNLSDFYIPAKSFTRVRKVFDKDKFVKINEAVIGDFLNTKDFTLDNFLKMFDEHVLDIFQYKKFHNLNIPRYSGSFDLLNITYKPEKNSLLETNFDWIPLDFYILYKKDSNFIPSLSAVLGSEKETLHEPSNIISAQALFKGNYKNPTPLLDTEIFFTVLESKPYNLENSKKISEELFKKFYMMILMKLEMRKHNIVIYTENLKDWPTDKSRNLQIKSLIRAKDAHRIDLIKSEKIVTLVINLNMQDNETIQQKWDMPSESEKHDEWRNDHPDTNTMYVEAINLALIKKSSTIGQLIENTRNYTSTSPDFLQKNTILELVLSYRIPPKENSLTIQILDTEDEYLVDRKSKPDGNNFVGQILMHIRNELVQDKTLVMKLFLDASGFFTEEMFNMQIDVKRKRPVFIILPIEPNFYGGGIDENLLEKSKNFLDSFGKIVNEKKNFSKNLKNLYSKELELDLLIHREKHPYPVWGGDPYLDKIPFEKYGLGDINLLESPIKIEEGQTSLYRTLSFILWGKEDYFIYIKASLFMYFLKLLYESPEFSELSEDQNSKGFTELDFSYLQKFLQEFFEDNNPPILTFLFPLFFKRTVIIFTAEKIDYIGYYNEANERYHINPIFMFFNTDSNSFTALPSVYKYNGWIQKGENSLRIHKHKPLPQKFMQELSTIIVDIQKVRNWKLGEFTKEDMLNSTRYWFDQ